MALSSRILICLGSLCLLLLTQSACSTTIQHPVIEAAGIAQRRPWIPIGPERLYAREISLDKARRRLWSNLMKEKSETGQSVEKMALLYPDFNSRLRGLVALAKVQSFEEQEKGSLTITIQMDQKSVRDLIQEYAERR